MLYSIVMGMIVRATREMRTAAFRGKEGACCNPSRSGESPTRSGSRWVRRIVSGCVLGTILFAVLGAGDLAGVDPAEPSDHWSFQPIRRPVLPAVSNRTWPQNPIDVFTLAAMEAQGLQPSPPAEPVTLARRLSFDLVGLPPAAGASDPPSLDRMIDRLFASPHYGERMALPWLDLARYADSHGYHMDAHRDMWRWRDWVIEACNAGMPFDRFTVEQLAGDLLPAATLSQQIATGFNRNHMINFEDGSIAEEFRTEYVVDRVATTSTVWLGLTMACCRCHDHKYDPLTQEEFYELFAFFNQVPEYGIDGDQGNAAPTIAAPSDLQQRAVQQLSAALAATEREILEQEGGEHPELDAWCQQTIGAGQLSEAPAAALQLAMDRGLGVGAPGHVWKGKARWVPGKFDGALLLDGKTHLELPQTLDGAAAMTFAAWVFPTTSDRMTIVAKGRFDEHPRGYELALREAAPVIRVFSEPLGNELRVIGKQPLKRNQWHHLAAAMDTTGTVEGLRLYVNGVRQEVRIEADQLRQPVRTLAPAYIGGPRDHFRGLIDQVQLFDRELSDVEVGVLAGNDPMLELLATPSATRTPEQTRRVVRYYLEETDAGYQRLLKQRESVSSELETLQSTIPTVMVMGTLSSPRETRLLESGLYDQPGDRVSADTPGVLPPMASDAPKNRLGLARWLVDPANPLVGRVAANRLWQHFFGRGIVPTADDFGLQGAPPSHPQLLDWLASELIASGWDIKHLQRLIVQSATYQQSSKQTEATQFDPENVWLTRGPSNRLPAELIRDSALRVSGLLVEDVGGPSVFPYQPPGLWEQISYDADEFSAQAYVQSRGANLYRRGLYVFWKRSLPPTSLAAFDAPTREVCTVKRDETNTPQQALALMNDPTLVEAARRFAAHILRIAGPEPLDRLRQATREALGRQLPAPSEEAMLQLIRDQQAHYNNHLGEARALLAVGDSVADPSLDAATHATWTSVASVLFQSHEFLTKP